MSKTKRKREKKNTPASTPRRPLLSKRNLRVLFSVAAGLLLGLAITAARHTWFASSSSASPSPSAFRPVVDAPGAAPEGMVWIPGGTFSMGSADIPDASPVHKVALDGFWMDKTEVTNADFKRFFDATGYVTLAEQKPNIPGMPREEAKKLEPFSIVFAPPEKHIDPNATDNPYGWWKSVKGANWQHPEGPESNLKGREKHPAVHIAFDDALAYARWAKKRLPTEAEWEYAARGGLELKKFCWGDEPRPGGKLMANTWQGEFPNKNTGEDGFLATAPAGSFPPNGFGLNDMAGNVWEWCADWYQPRYYEFSPELNPQGPRASFDPQEPNVPKRVQRGGSFLCAENYCQRYLPGARGKGEPSSGANHTGFRCVRSAGASQ